MKKKYLVCAAVASLLAAGCSTVKHGEVKASDHSSRIEVTVDSDRHVRITNARALQDENTVKVSGTLRPKSSTTRMAGHIHISFIWRRIALYQKCSGKTATIKRPSSKGPYILTQMLIRSLKSNT